MPVPTAQLEANHALIKAFVTSKSPALRRAIAVNELGLPKFCRAVQPLAYNILYNDSIDLTNAQRKYLRANVDLLEILASTKPKAAVVLKNLDKLPKILSKSLEYFDQLLSGGDGT